MQEATPARTEAASVVSEPIAPVTEPISQSAVPILPAGMVPAADALATRRWGRGLGLVLLAVSALSVSYPAWNPWRHPWLYNLFEALGWIHY